MIGYILQSITHRVCCNIDPQSAPNLMQVSPRQGENEMYYDGDLLVFVKAHFFTIKVYE